MDQHKSWILAHSRPAIERLRRHRWAVAGVGGFALLGMMTAFALTPADTHEPVQLETVLEKLALPAAQPLEMAETSFLREEHILRSDTLASLIGRLGITDPEAQDFIRSHPSTQAIARQLRPGKVVTAKTGIDGTLQALYFPLNGKDATLVVSRDHGHLSAHEEALQLEPQVVVKAAEIRTSLFGATDDAGIPDAIATQLAEIFSADIDFYRDLRKGDRFALVYETLTYQGQPIRTGRILSAEFVNDRKTHSAYWFQGNDGRGGYYSAEGKSLRKAFLRSPLEFSRITSGFSNARFHPILQVSRAHKGIDYGAPVGTKVRSVADGVVEFAGRQNGYGNFVVIKHQGAFSTAYGHLNGFAAGLRKGSRVRQGDTIAYVGQTGMATGPHLHYEFRVRSVQVNPLAVALPTAIPLEASQISRFKKSIEPLRTHLALAKDIWPDKPD